MSRIVLFLALGCSENVGGEIDDGETDATEPYGLFPEGTTILGAGLFGGLCSDDTETPEELPRMYYTIDDNELIFGYHGDIVGCGFPDVAVVGVEPSSTGEGGVATLKWNAGDCGFLVCIHAEAILVGLTGGPWEFREDRTGLTIEFDI